MTNAAMDGANQIYEFTGSKVFDGKIYLTLMTVESDGNGDFPATAPRPGLGGAGWQAWHRG